jgi:hypothetical protein
MTFRMNQQRIQNNFDIPKSWFAINVYLLKEIVALFFRHQNKTFCSSKLSWMFPCQTTIVCMYNTRGSKSCHHLMSLQIVFYFNEMTLLKRGLIILRVKSLSRQDEIWKLKGFIFFLQESDFKTRHKRDSGQWQYSRHQGHTSSQNAAAC